MALLPLLTRSLGQPLFLPAHGRGAALPAELRKLLQRRAGLWDLPELPSLGGPLEPNGAIGESQRAAAAAIGVDHCWYGVNGATGLLQAALLGIASPGETVLLPRNCHRSVIQACVLGDLNPLLFDLPFQTDRGHPAPVDGAWMKKVLAALPHQTPRIAAALLVHPTYQGYATNPKPLIDGLHSLGCPVLVDEAHGAHFAAHVDEHLPKSALQGGADLVVHSLQKSATGLAQTAVLWMQGQRVDPDRIRRSLGLLQTSSPSALLLASCGSWVQLTGLGQQVEVRSEGQIGACQSLGRASSTTLDRLLLIERNTSRQEDELLTLARNEAGNMGGNAIVPMTAASAGKQSFAVYRCP